MIDCIINHDCKTSCGLIAENGSSADGLFTNWKFGFVFDPRLHDQQSWQWCANGCNNCQQCWELRYIMGRIQPIRLCKPCVMRVRGCWKSWANGSNIVAPRFGDHGTKEMFGIAGWPVLNFAQQLPTIRNKMQKGCKWTQHETSINVGSFCTGLKMKRWMYEFQIFELRDEEITIITFFASISLSRGSNM